MSPLVDVPADEAAIIVELIDHHHAMNEQLPQLYGHVRDAFGALGMEIDAPTPHEHSFMIRRGLAELRKKYSAIAFPGEEQRAQLEQHLMRDLLREVRQPRTLKELVARFLLAPLAEREELGAQLQRFLLALEELGHVRQLEDGHHVIRWEITEAGEREL